MRLIIADDNYASRLAELLGGIEEFKSLEIVAATNLEETKLAMDASNGISTAVLTDMFLPDVAEPTNADEAIELYKKICLHYHVSARWLDEMIGEVKPMLDELYKKSAELRAYLRAEGVADYTHDQLMGAFLYEYKDREDVSEEAKARIDEWFHYERKHGKTMIETLRRYQEDGIFSSLKYVRLDEKADHTGVEWGFGVCLIDGFRGGGVEGMPMGTRIAEEAHQRNIPVVIASGDHGTGPLGVISTYLRETGVIDSGKHISPWETLEQDGSLKVGASELVDSHSFFIVNKGLTPDQAECGGYQEQQAKHDVLLVEIVRSLIRRLS